MPRKLSQKTLEVRAREAKAYDLQLSGATFVDIARQLGYAGASGARFAFLRYVKRLGPGPEAEQKRQLQLQRLERLLLAVWTKAIAQPPSIKAVQEARRLIHAIAELADLYPARQAKVDVELTDKRIDLEGLTIDALAELADGAEAISRLDPDDVAFLERFGWDAPQPRSPTADGVSGGDGHDPATD